MIQNRQYLKIILLIITMATMIPTISFSQKNSSLNEKVENILTQLTLDEKLSMIHASSKFTTGGVERLGIPEWRMSDGPHGVREEINRDNWEPANLDDDFSTYLPTGTALAATWNPKLAFKFGEVLGREARARNKDVILGPGINIHRTPLCGRNFEYMSEDPYLISELVVPYIKGVQEQDVAACVKHYTANNQEYERFRVNIEIDERTLREIYLPGFKAAFQKGNVHTAMAAYNKFRGKWCSESEYLLSNILKKEWEWDGVVISDWAGTHSTIDAAKAGLDIEMGTEKNDYKDFYFADALKKAVENGNVKEEVINDKVRRILTIMFKTKIFDSNRSKGEFISERNFKVAKDVAAEAVVLLKNEKNILPLNIKNVKSIAVIGENAIIKHANGGVSSGIKTKYEITPLAGLNNILGEDVEINFAKGYESTSHFECNDGRTELEEIDFERVKNLRNEAVEVAKKSEYVIMFMGLNHDYDTECADKNNMNLPYFQDELIAEILNVNKNVIVFLTSGSAVNIQNWVNDVPGIIENWYSGSEAGNVFAEILFGKVNPSGKLPFTFPKKLEDVPAYKFGDVPGRGLQVEYKEGIFVGYRYYDTFNVEPQFAFGHGLSYTTFDFKTISLNKSKINIDENIVATLTIKNTGKVAGSEVVQLYIEDVKSSVKRPIKELKGFKKVNLKPGEIKEIQFNIDSDLLSFYDINTKEFKAEKGKFRLHIGSASDDIRVKSEFELVEK